MNAAPISGSPQNPIQAPQNNQQNVKDMSEALTMLKADLQELSDESVNFAALMKSDSGKEANKATSQRLDQAKKDEGAQHLDQAAQAAMTDEVDDDKKLRKKKEEAKKFEDKLKLIGAFVKEIDKETLPEELREELEKFEENLNRISQKKGHLKRLESQLQHYQSILDQAEGD